MDTLNWKNINIDKNVDELRRESLTEDASIRKVNDWKLGSQAKHWNKHTEYVTNPYLRNDTDNYITGLKFTESKLDQPIEEAVEDEWEDEPDDSEGSYVLHNEDGYYHAEGDSFTDDIEGVKRFNSEEEARDYIYDFLADRAHFLGFGQEWANAALDSIDVEKLDESKNKGFKNFMKTLCEKIQKNTHLTEELKDASDFEEIKKAMKDDPELDKFMNTKLEDLPENYKYLIGRDSWEDMKNVTPAEYMEFFYKVYPFFSKLTSENNNELLGWVSYYTYGPTITDIKMFSFKPQYQNIEFMRDLKEFFKNISDKYSVIRWTADKDNPFIKHYYEAIKLFQGDAIDNKDGHSVTFIIDKFKNKKELNEAIGGTDLPEEAAYALEHLYTAEDCLEDAKEVYEDPGFFGLEKDEVARRMDTLNAAASIHLDKTERSLEFINQELHESNESFHVEGNYLYDGNKKIGLFWGGLHDEDFGLVVLPEYEDRKEELEKIAEDYYTEYFASKNQSPDWDFGPWVEFENLDRELDESAERDQESEDEFVDRIAHIDMPNGDMQGVVEAYADKNNLGWGDEDRIIDRIRARRIELEESKMKESSSDIEELKYLYDKEQVCPLDKEERYRLQDLIQQYGNPEDMDFEDVPEFDIIEVADHIMDVKDQLDSEEDLIEEIGDYFDINEELAAEWLEKYKNSSLCTEPLFESKMTESGIKNVYEDLSEFVDAYCSEYDHVLSEDEKKNLIQHIWDYLSNTSKGEKDFSEKLNNPDYLDGITRKYFENPEDFKEAKQASSLKEDIAEIKNGPVVYQGFEENFNDCVLVDTDGSITYVMYQKDSFSRLGEGYIYSKTYLDEHNYTSKNPNWFRGFEYRDMKVINGEKYFDYYCKVPKDQNYLENTSYDTVYGVDSIKEGVSYILERTDLKDKKILKSERSLSESKLKESSSTSTAVLNKTTNTIVAIYKDPQKAVEAAKRYNSMTQVVGSSNKFEAVRFTDLRNKDYKFSRELLDKACDVLAENSVYSRSNEYAFYVIKRVTDNKYFSLDADDVIVWSDNLNDAETFDEGIEAESKIDDYLTDNLPEEYVGNLDDEKAEEMLNYQDEQREAYEIVGIKAGHFHEKKMKESKEKDVKVDFEIPVNEKGRIKANDAKKLLKYLVSNKLLRLNHTYFVTDINNNMTCWDLERDEFSGYTFNCEVTETPAGEEVDVYHSLSFDKNGSKLTNFEWEAHRV